MISHVIAGNLKAAKVLAKYGIDFCTEGNKTLRDACRDRKFPVSKMIAKIAAAEASQANPVPDVSSMAIDELTYFLEKHYHRVTCENIAFIKTNMARVVRVHGRKYPEQEEINRIFGELTARLTVQMQHEEFILFPYIREMVKRGRKVKTSIFRSAKSPIREMVSDNKAQDDSLKKLDHLTRHYSIPDECTCSAFKITYTAMRELEKELHEYRSLEDDILFPKALEMEVKFNRATWQLSN